MRLFIKLSLVVLSVLMISTFILAPFGCIGKNSTLLPNIPPITQLSNIPPTTDTLSFNNPRLTLYWKADDPDGYIVGYKYRWSYPINGTVYYKPWSTIINTSIIIKDSRENFAILFDTTIQNSQDYAPELYKYFSTIDLTDTTLVNGIANVLDRGDTLSLQGVKLFASNPSSVRFPVHTSPSGGTFIFDSQDSINFHTFEISAIDNSGLVGPPATISFNTQRVELPHTQITSAPSGDNNFVLSKITDTWPGLKFQFQGNDPNSRIIQFSWNVDSLNEDGTKHSQFPAKPLRWSSWSDETSAKITGSDFADPYSTDHVFSVRSRNEFGSIDTAGFFSHNCDTATGICETTYARVQFKTLFPAFKRPSYTQKILLINGSYKRDTTLANAMYPTHRMLDDYYDTLFKAIGKVNFDKLDASTIKVDSFRGSAPLLLSKYSMVFMYFDTYDTSELCKGSLINALVGEVLGSVIQDYCNIGGKVVISSWNLLGTDRCFANLAGAKYYSRISHVDLRRGGCDPRGGIQPLSQESFDFLRGKADSTKTFPYITAQLDPLKLDPAWNGALDGVQLIVPYSFGEGIYTYTSAGRDTSCFRFIFPGGIIGARYKGVTYSVVYYGFPLYYVQKNIATEILRHSLLDIKE